MKKRLLDSKPFIICFVFTNDQELAFWAKSYIQILPEEAVFGKNVPKQHDQHVYWLWQPNLQIGNSSSLIFFPFAKNVVHYRHDILTRFLADAEMSSHSGLWKWYLPSIIDRNITTCRRCQKGGQPTSLWRGWVNMVDMTLLFFFSPGLKHYLQYNTKVTKYLQRIHYYSTCPPKNKM